RRRKLVERELVCPSCGDGRHLIKVSAIVAGGTGMQVSQNSGVVQTSLIGLAAGQPYNRYSTTSSTVALHQSQLAQALTLDSPPDPLTETIKAAVIVIGATLAAMAWVSAQLNLGPVGLPTA